ncbi:MAG: VOC family protein [Candidatus Eremiobacteraeota bacterium]|nr:VOC family protein [Candidatus Eremiobacteraeota bacterium]
MSDVAKFSIVMLVCSDLVRSRDFYRDVLRPPVRQDLPKRPVRFELCGGAILSLHRKSDVLAVRPGSLQLGFNVEDVDRFVADCVARGVPVFQDPYDEPFGRIAIVGDPDGYPVQVATLVNR